MLVPETGRRRPSRQRYFTHFYHSFRSVERSFWRDVVLPWNIEGIQRCKYSKLLRSTIYVTRARRPFATPFPDKGLINTYLVLWFFQTLRHLCIGQYPTISRSKDYSQFTLDYYNKLADNKCTYYTFKLPLFMSHLLAGKPYIDIFDNTEEIFAKMGILIVMQVRSFKP